MRTLWTVLLAAGLALAPAALSARPQNPDRQDKDKKDKKEEKKEKDKKDKKDKKDRKDKKPEKSDSPTDPREFNREITRTLREMQFALEGGSPRSLLALIDSAKFDDYPRFEDMVERLLREDSIRAYFRQVNSSSSAEGKGQSVVDAEMEVARKDAAGQVQRRRQQLVLDFERTRRGWRIINITPRNYFQPL